MRRLDGGNAAMVAATNDRLQGDCVQADALSGEGQKAKY